MAESRPAVDIDVGYGLFRLKVKIESALLAAGITGAAAGLLTLGAFYRANPELVEFVVRSVFTHFADRVPAITPSSILVELCCHTKERFLAFMDAFEAKIVKQRLQEELSKIGFKDELEVTIVNEKDVYGNASRIRKEMKERSSEFGEASESSGVEPMESEETISPQPSPQEPLTPAPSELEGEELPEEVTSASAKSRKEMEESSSESESSGYESMGSEETISPQPSPQKPLTPAPMELEGEELPEQKTSASATSRKRMMTGAAASPMKSVKSGKLEDDDLVELAFAIADKWITLGRRLGVSEPILNTIAHANQELTEKGYYMLREWKQRGSAVTYEALYHALKHERVGLPDLAEKFCSDG